MSAQLVQLHATTSPASTMVLSDPATAAVVGGELWERVVRNSLVALLASQPEVGGDVLDLLGAVLYCPGELPDPADDELNDLWDYPSSALNDLLELSDVL